jgi:putative addiction module component (TIGR02574 family)
MPSATRRYQSAMLGARQSKHEVLWEAPNVAFDRLIEPTSAHSVDSCEFQGSRASGLALCVTTYVVSGLEVPRKSAVKSYSGAPGASILRAAAGRCRFARPLASIQDEIRALSTPEKEALLRALWEELDGPADRDVDAAWLAEAQRRDRELESGGAQSLPADEVFSRLEASLKK